MFILFVYDPILYNIYIYIHTYIYVAYLYSNYCCIFGILTAFSGCYYLDVNPYPWIPLDHILTAGRVKYIYICIRILYIIYYYIYILLLNYQSDVFLVFSSDSATVSFLVKTWNLEVVPTGTPSNQSDGYAQSPWGQDCSRRDHGSESLRSIEVPTNT